MYEISNQCRYSSRAAQKADWHAGHKIECKCWRKLRSSGSSPSDYVPESPIRLMLRILWKRERDLKLRTDGETAPFWQSFAAVASLVDHTHIGSNMSDSKRATHQHIARKATCAPSEHFNTITVNCIRLQRSV